MHWLQGGGDQAVPPPVEMRYRLEGSAKERFKAPPEPYIHPYIFFDPEDVAIIRKHIKTIKPSMTAMEAVRKGLGQQPL